jgi:hypothetical protein
LTSVPTANFELPLDMGSRSGLVSCADLVTEFRDTDGARVLLERLVPFADLLPYDGTSAAHPVSHCLSDAVKP